MKQVVQTNNFLNINIKLTKNEIVILDFINNYKKSSFNKTIEDFAKELNTSASAITRFIKKYKFSCYKDFLIYFNNCLTKRFDEPDIWDEDFSEEQQESLQKYKQYIDILLKEDNKKEIEKLIYCILKSRRILIFGMGSSSLCARELNNSLAKIGLNAFKNDDMHLFINLLANSNNNDLVIIISNKMSGIEINFILEIAKINKIKIAAITSTSQTNILSQVDYKINYRRIYNTKKFVSVSSKVYQILISDIIFENLINSNQKLLKQYKRSQYFLNLWSKFRRD